MEEKAIELFWQISFHAFYFGFGGGVIIGTLFGFVISKLLANPK